MPRFSVASAPTVLTLSLLSFPALALSGCARTHTADIGTPVSVSHPVGAYSSEFRWGNNAHVIYAVENASLTETGRMDFDLTVTVPPLGRVFGFVRMEVTCVAGGETSSAHTHERLGEAYDGTFEFPMWCAVPEEADLVAIEIDHHDEHLRFEGSVD
ncbi:hypothetical protein [Nocardiopsis valliformis]|uniref:hypothetical protein n=1 Tax=Nocardiopsis valliformis TaxID=239974 RepID=UPI0003474DE4|nr:hypothetical protein [Nocardiopsis valliformis]